MSKVAFRQAEVARAASALKRAGFQRVEFDLRTGKIVGHTTGAPAASNDDPERFDEEWAALDQGNG